MANGIKVETDELLACAKKYASLAESFKTVSDKTITKCKSYEDVWKGSFSEDLDSKVKKLEDAKNKIYNNCIELSKHIENAVAQYIAVDQGLASSDTIGTADYPNNVTVSVHVKSDEELKQFYSDTINNSPSYNGWNKYYDGIRPGSVNCTWYTAAKMKANGFNIAHFYPSNGKDWFNGVNSTDIYTATKYAGANCLKDLINAKGQPVTDIVLSFPYSAGGGKYGHVMYIDKIVDGKVYFSDNWQKGVPQSMSIDELIAKYKGYGNGAPIGCVHLKKK